MNQKCLGKEISSGSAIEIAFAESILAVTAASYGLTLPAGARNANAAGSQHAKVQQTQSLQQR